MANDLEQIVLSISANTRWIQRTLKKLETDSSVSTKKIKRQFDGLGKKVDNSFIENGASASGMLKVAGLCRPRFRRRDRRWNPVSASHTFLLQGNDCVGAGSTCCGRHVMADEMIAATGFRPDHSFLSEMLLRLDFVIEAPIDLARLDRSKRT